MSTTPVCTCDTETSTSITNLPGLSQIVYRAADFNGFRRALLTPLLADVGQPPLEQSLNSWQSGAGADPTVADLGVMMVEWWAYIADILTFYNERITNESYLRTAALPETPGAIIRLLGYRPRPAIAATGTLAALTTPGILPGQKVTLPASLQFQSKPGLGGTPQTFELSQATVIGVPAQVSAVPPASLVGAQGGSYRLLLKGTVTSLNNGSLLLLGQRDNTGSTQPSLITLTAPPLVQSAAGGGKQTLLTFASNDDLTPLTASNARLLQPGQSASLWTANSGAVSASTVQMASLLRQIRPGDWVVATGGSPAAQLLQVSSISDVLGDVGSGGSPTKVAAATATYTPIPVLHSALTFTSTPSLTAPTQVSLLFGWAEPGVLADQPIALWKDPSVALQPIGAAQFPVGTNTPVLLADSVGNGQAATANSNIDGTLTVTFPSQSPLGTPLLAPINVCYNLLAISRGKTVAKEILGSGDATVPGQSFKLAKSPVTYLAAGAGYASTIQLTINGQPWSEIASFYSQPADAQVFTTREDSAQSTWVDFGDGVNGARLPTGANNVIASYRMGAGADSPPAGKLTVIAQSYPGLQSILNPVAVSGGSDPDSAALLKQYAPRSVLAFGRAVSVFDYQALAAQAPGVTMATATWAWDPLNLRAGVTVYVAGEVNVATSVQTQLLSAGDPNRPITVYTAKAAAVTLVVALVVVAGMDADAITAAVETALCDPVSGLFAPPQMSIGQPLFDSIIQATCLAVNGVVAIKSSAFIVNGITDPGPLHSPGDGVYFTLPPANFISTTEVGAYA